MIIVAIGASELETKTSGRKGEGVSENLFIYYYYYYYYYSCS